MFPAKVAILKLKGPQIANEKRKDTAQSRQPIKQRY